MPAGTYRAFKLPARYSIEGRVHKNAIKQLNRAAIHEEFAVESKVIKRSSYTVLHPDEGTPILIADRRLTVTDEPIDVFRCRNWDAFVGGSSELEGEWLTPAPARFDLLSPSQASEARDAVLNGWRGAFEFREERRDGDRVIETGLRPPQIGALFGVLSHWKTSSLPATVVMPTGTGKTETMLALLARERLSRLLVIVPTGALRDQIGDKFVSMGLLKQLGAVR